jgi:hypothetical protein
LGFPKKDKRGRKVTIEEVEEMVHMEEDEQNNQEKHDWENKDEK